MLDVIMLYSCCISTAKIQQHMVAMSIINHRLRHDAYSESGHDVLDLWLEYARISELYMYDMRTMRTYVGST